MRNSSRLPTRDDRHYFTKPLLCQGSEAPLGQGSPDQFVTHLSQNRRILHASAGDELASRTIRDTPSLGMWLKPPTHPCVRLTLASDPPRDRRTTSGSSSMIRSMSASVFSRPRLNRIRA